MSTALKQAQHWVPLDAMDEARRSGLQQSVRVWIAAHPGATLDHDPAWLAVKAQGEGRSIRLFVLEDAQGRLLGVAPFFVHPSSFAFEYAAKTLLSVRTRRLSITAQPLLAEGVDESVEFSNLLGALASTLGHQEVLFGLGVPLDTAFARSLQTPSVLAKYIVMPHGPSYARRLLRLPESLDAYLAALGPKSRADLRRHERRLAKAADEQVSVSVHASADSVPEFLRSAAEVSRLTYQWRMHGIGVDADPATERLFLAMAEGGWLRGYLLHAKGKAVAFMVGYLHRGVYYSETIGYDPAWADYAAGNVLHMNVVRDLTALTPKVEWFDFMYGDNSNKERLSTDSRLEGNFYLVPRTWRWTLTLGALRRFDAFTGWLNLWLERHGLRDRLRRWLRRRASESA